jgi:hypothetical protein
VVVEMVAAAALGTGFFHISPIFSLFTLPFLNISISFHLLLVENVV